MEQMEQTTKIVIETPEGSIWPDDGTVQAPPADPDEIRAWFGRA